MSLLDDLNRLFRSIFQNINPDSVGDGSKEFDISGRDELAVSMAERNYALIYSPDNTPGSLTPFVNTLSPLNVLFSSLGNVLFLFSASIITALLGCFLMLGGIAVNSGVAMALEIYFSSIYAISILAGTSLVASLALRKLDRFVAMKKCLDEAERALQDPKIRCQEQCLIEMQKVDAEIKEEQAPYIEKVLELRATIESLIYMTAGVEETRKLNPTEVEKELAPYYERIRGLTERVVTLNKKISEIEEDGEVKKAKILKSQAMATLLHIGEDLIALEDGSLDRQIEDMVKSTNENMDRIETRIENLHDDLLVESGVLRLEDKGSQKLK